MGCQNDENALLKMTSLNEILMKMNVNELMTADRVKELEGLPFAIMNPEAIECIKEGKCPTCKKEINIDDFNMKLEKKEYTISGLCAACQRDFFK